MAGNNMPVLSFDIVDEGKIQKLEELAEKIKNAFSVGPGGFRVTMPGVLPGNPIDHEANKSPAQNSRDHSAPENRSRDEKGRFLATGKAKQ